MPQPTPTPQTPYLSEALSLTTLNQPLAVCTLPQLVLCQGQWSDDMQQQLAYVNQGYMIIINEIIWVQPQI